MESVYVTVGTDYEYGVFTVGFADEDSLGALLFSQSDTIDEQDSFLGFDTYCVSTDTGATFYGGVESARVDGTELALRFTPGAAEKLGVPRDLVLRFEDEAGVTVARDGLRRVGVATVSS